MRLLPRQPPLPQTAMILISPTAKTIPPATDAPAMIRAATGVTATRTVIAAETAGAATDLVTAMAAAVARPTPSRPPAARPAVIEAVDVAAEAVMITEIVTPGAAEEAVMATTTGAVAAVVVDAHARDPPAATFTGPAMIDESIVIGGIGEVAMMTTAVGEVGRLARIDQSARRRRLL